MLNAVVGELSIQKLKLYIDLYIFKNSFEENRSHSNYEGAQTLDFLINSNKRDRLRITIDYLNTLLMLENDSLNQMVRVYGQKNKRFFTIFLCSRLLFSKV